MSEENKDYIGQPGEKMPDGSVHVGNIDGREMYTMPVDASDKFNGSEYRLYGALQLEEKLNREQYLGHDDWRVPNQKELARLFENRNKGALKGTFNVSGSYPLGWYWSSSQNFDTRAWAQSFGDGSQHWTNQLCGLSLRLVRG